MLTKKFTTREKAILIVLFLLLPIFFFLLLNTPAFLGNTNKIELTPLEVQSGETTIFKAKISGNKGMIRLPNNTIPMMEGRVYDMQNLSFKGGEFSFQAVIPPGVDSINIKVENGKSSKTFNIIVTQGLNPFVSGEQIYERMGYVTDESNGIAHRVTTHPQLLNGALYFRDVFRSYGLEAEVVRYGLPPSGDNPIRKAVGAFIWNVVAYHWGENTKEWIVLGGHYDMSWETMEGAYDNTAGTTLVLEIAKGISQISTNKTIVFCLWAGEEEGLWGAQKFVDTIPDDVEVKTYLNFDMAGINYPAPFALRASVGADDDPGVIENEELIRLTNQTAFQILGYPRETGVRVIEESHRGSDHYRFEEIGVPIIFFHGASTSEYEAYHTPDDTLEEMERVAGGIDNLIDGFDTVAWIGFYLTLLLDNDDTVHQQF